MTNTPQTSVHEEWLTLHEVRLAGLLAERDLPH